MVQLNFVSNNAIGTPNNLDIKWLSEVWQSVPEFLKSIEDPIKKGLYLPCKSGSTAVGKKISLGFSCFGLKTCYMLGLWDKLSDTDRRSWGNYIKSFQVKENERWKPFSRNSFIDRPLIEWASKHVNYKEKLLIMLKGRYEMRGPIRIIFSDTKQAIATLSDIGAKTERPYNGFPANPKSVKKFLNVLNWQKPWGVGGIFAALSLFLVNDGPRQLDEKTAQNLIDICRQYIESLADSETGCYYSGNRPEYSQLINGAMKVLTALDWLEVKIHHPEKLIDTCLSKKPIGEGCHLVDIIYVLYRCMKETEYKRIQVQEYCMEILPLIKKHYNGDGGFSYYIQKAQTNYYGVPITNGLPESDIHGTCLLIWALTMISSILEIDNIEYNIIRP